ncbi:hypothetical protein [Schaalia cardiffensis]|nr:hypothetical protein [Schaalia cardiffensis]
MMHAFDRIVDYMEPEHDEDAVVDWFGDDADHAYDMWKDNDMEVWL